MDRYTSEWYVLRGRWNVMPEPEGPHLFRGGPIAEPLGRLRRPGVAVDQTNYICIKPYTSGCQ
jgi:hypothetical protein